jgi:hypothetical protein
MLPDDKVYCHRTGFRKKCVDMVTKRHCRLWKHVIGLNRNTNQPMDHYDCVDSLKVDLTIENTQMQRETGAAVESTRNEYVRSSDRNLEVMLQVQNEFRQAIAAIGQEVLAIRHDEMPVIEHKQ